VTEICLTDKFKVARLNDGTVLKWGTYPEPVLDSYSAPLEDITQISCGPNGACARTSGGTAYCFGNEAILVFTEVFSMPFTDVSSISAGKTHNCLTTATKGEVYCWGSHSFGELGSLYTTKPDGVPQKAEGIKGAIGVSTGANGTCAWTKTGDVRCWGANFSGQVGLGAVVGSQPKPVQVANLSGVDALAAGSTAMCAIGDAGTFCWGYGDVLGYGAGTALSAPFTDAPVALGKGPGAAPADLTQVSMGSEIGCGIDTTGQALCWGNNTKGGLGDDTTESRPWAAPVTYADGSPLTEVKSIAAGTTHACAVKDDGNVLCWGNNAHGQTGHPSGASNTPEGVLRSEGGPLTGATGVWAGHEFTCAITGDEGNVYCWGHNKYGQAGAGPAQSVPHAQLVTREDTEGPIPMTGMVALGIGADHVCGYGNSGQSAWCWGYNLWGSLGQGMNYDGPKGVAIAVKGLANVLVSGITAGTHYNCVTSKTPKKAYCWGINDSGQLGAGDQDYWNPPGPVAMGASELVAVSAGAKATCALDLNGNVWCWGNGAGGLLGDGTYATHQPTKVEGLEEPGME
jgi:alpha-tubulin suppressor-like RCC1 family protein